jgi:hypothetical protein
MNFMMCASDQGIMANGQSLCLNGIMPRDLWEVVGPPGLEHGDVGYGGLRGYLSRAALIRSM